MTDESTYSADQLTRLERELAAVVRQYGRAIEACDWVAQDVEAEAICDRIKWLLYHHLDLRGGMTDDNWVWLNDNEEDRQVEQSGPFELRACGRIWCSLPDGRREWTEPFLAYIRHSSTDAELSHYTVWFASRATMLDLPTVRRLVKHGEVVAPPQPAREGDWAFVFRMGEHG